MIERTELRTVERTGAVLAAAMLAVFARDGADADGSTKGKSKDAPRYHHLRSTPAQIVSGFIPKSYFLKKPSKH